AFTAVWAGAFQLRELQYFAGNYRQVLNSEGLTGFVDASYGWGRPGTEILELLAFKTRSLVFEGGFSYPVIRTRERNLTVTGLAFSSDSDSDLLDTTFKRDRLRGFRL